MHHIYAKDFTRVGFLAACADGGFGWHGFGSLALFFQPRDYVGVELHGDSLFQRAIEFAADGVFPRVGREFRRSVDFTLGHRR